MITTNRRREHHVAARPSTVLLALALGAAALGSGAPAQAAESADGAGGQTLTVTQSTGLDPDGTRVTVTGTGFDETKGIYVAECVDNGPGARPTPCIGGIDMSGDAGASAWISSNPPGYGEGLAVPFDDGGSFEVTLTVQAADEQTDCLDPAVAPDGCVLAAFADHTRIDDRSSDVLIPLVFGGESNATEPDGPTADPTTDVADDPTSAEVTAEPTEEPTSDAPDEPSVAAEAATTEPGTSAGSGPFWLYLVLGLGVAGSAIAVIVQKARTARRAEAGRPGQGAGPSAGAGTAGTGSAGAGDAGPEDAGSGETATDDTDPGDTAPDDRPGGHGA